MAVAEIIGAAIGVLLLVVVAYLLVGGTLTAAETMANAQKDLTMQNEVRLRTSINITANPPSTDTVIINVTNNGNEIISDYSHMDVYSYNGTQGFQYYTYDHCTSCTPGTGYWAIQSFENDHLHPKELDPGERMNIIATFPGVNPIRFQVTTSNGVSAQTAI